MLSNVDLPQPVGPTTATNSPPPMTSVVSRTAVYGFASALRAVNAQVMLSSASAGALFHQGKRFLVALPLNEVGQLRVGSGRQIRGCRLDPREEWKQARFRIRRRHLLHCSIKLAQGFQKFPFSVMHVEPIPHGVAGTKRFSIATTPPAHGICAG